MIYDQQPSPPQPSRAYWAAVICAMAFLVLVPLAASIVAVVAYESPAAVIDGSERETPRRPLLRRPNRLDAERESTPVNWEAAAETKGQRYRRVPCATCPSGYRLVPVQYVHGPTVRTPYHLTPSQLGLPPGSRIVSVTERVVQPYPQIVTPYQAPSVHPRDEVKTGSYFCPRCQRYHLGGQMHSVTLDRDGDPVPVLCERCWGQTSPSQRAQYVHAEMLRAKR